MSKRQDRNELFKSAPESAKRLADEAAKRQREKDRKDFRDAITGYWDMRKRKP